MSRLFLSAAFGLALCYGALFPKPTVAQDRALWLYDGEEETVSGYFYAGEDIYASCDEDCYDLDLFLYDSAGRIVDSDTLDDSFPIVQAPYEGNFSVRVKMYDCAHTAGCAVEVSSDYGF
ncbi:hypothetical protein NIES970_01100 [[Synechococcus] sp. NIES-970]|uniref:hypothetical protein n=1 Tax=Picosynechococcus sp. NKBG15041c TaxID=1407650 RepID=UPI0003FEF8E7|nr:hypothetical protein [Picosynechococcus sp. NKBG15041c]BAW95208.1 hypothetical protein NIES970_01100 [[Synechococcus] sp. NIES-970]